MKKSIALLLVVGFATVSAESARITYAPALGTKTRYRMQTTTSAKVLEFKMPGDPAQGEQIRKTLESATNTKVTMDNLETVLKVEADGSRVVGSSMTMSITSAALPDGMKAGFNVTSRYGAGGTIEIQRFEVDPKRTSKELASALGGETTSFKNLFKQSANLGFYGKTLSEKPVEVRLEVPSPTGAANINLKYTLRATYTLNGRTPKGGYVVGYTTRLEPASATTKQNGLDLQLRLEGEEAKGEVTLLPDGRVERMAQPMTMLMDSTVSGKGQQMTYKLRINVDTSMNIVP